jgi:potassium efflux system protein
MIEKISSFMNMIFSYFVNGFTIGEVTISLGSIFLGIFFFIVSIKIIQWLKGKFENRWLQNTKLSNGAREAALSITWYAAIGLVTIISLAIAGLNIGNLALVAGALSVGIGFGLQNIVSNFISGLIILFERPIKRGDWIVVGSTEGFVKEINIRSTRIQTFDQADILIPNSDLITNQLTNWMLTSSVGRVRIPIGVAYGSDTTKVKSVLLKIAELNDQVILNDENISAPQVIFHQFADSSLEFELRIFIKDILNIVQVKSDLNFEIDRQFRKENIQIPFPQRDIHIKRD